MAIQIINTMAQNKIYHGGGTRQVCRHHFGVELLLLKTHIAIIIATMIFFKAPIHMRNQLRQWFADACEIFYRSIKPNQSIAKSVTVHMSADPIGSTREIKKRRRVAKDGLCIAESARRAIVKNLLHRAARRLRYMHKDDQRISARLPSRVRRPPSSFQRSNLADYCREITQLVRAGKRHARGIILEPAAPAAGLRAAHGADNARADSCH